MSSHDTGEPGRDKENLQLHQKKALRSIDKLETIGKSDMRETNEGMNKFDYIIL